MRTIGKVCVVLALGMCASVAFAQDTETQPAPAEKKTVKAAPAKAQKTAPAGTTKSPASPVAEAPAAEEAPAPEEPADEGADETIVEEDTSETEGEVNLSAEQTAVADDSGEEHSVVGKTGVGYFTTSAPIGIRRWATENWGYDLGLGFGIESDNASHPETAWNANMEAGVLYALAHLENIIVFLRGGIGFGLEDSGQVNQDVDFTLNMNATLGGEFFLTALGFPNLSLSGGVGAQLAVLKPDNGDTQVGISTGSYGVDIVQSAAVSGMLGFHIYFF